MPTPTIHQFSPTVAPGDGVTRGVFYVDKLLKRLGYSTAIYSHRPPFELRQQVQDIHRFEDEPCDLLIVHHSMGHDLDDWLDRLRCPLLMIYHNITPAEYFPPQSGHFFYAHKGRRQLEEWCDKFVGAIGDSPFTTKELIQLGYTNVVCLPLLLDMASLEEATQPIKITPGHPRILAVGRLVENKRQHLLVEAMAHLNLWISAKQAPQLLLAGDTSDHSYRLRIEEDIAKWGLADRVILTGKVSDGQLRWLYSNADILWCASAHEGFCLPLVEASFFDLPIVALDHPAVTDTLGTAGMILKEPDPDQLAAVSAQVLASPALQASLIAAGRENLKRFDEDHLLSGLQSYLHDLGFVVEQR